MAPAFLLGGLPSASPAYFFSHPTRIPGCRFSGWSLKTSLLILALPEPATLSNWKPLHQHVKTGLLQNTHRQQTIHRPQWDAFSSERWTSEYGFILQWKLYSSGLCPPEKAGLGESSEAHQAQLLGKFPKGLLSLVHHNWGISVLYHRKHKFPEIPRERWQPS